MVEMPKKNPLAELRDYNTNIIIIIIIIIIVIFLIAH